MSRRTYGDGDLMVLCAFRYCLGRKTYMVSNCVEWLVREWINFDEDVRNVIKKELDEAFLLDDSDRAANPTKSTGALGYLHNREDWARVKQLYAPKAPISESDRLIKKWYPVLNHNYEDGEIPEYLYARISALLDVQALYRKDGTNFKSIDGYKTALVVNFLGFVPPVIATSFALLSKNLEFNADISKRKFKARSSFKVSYKELEIFTELDDASNTDIIRALRGHIMNGMLMDDGGVTTSVKIKPHKDGVEVLIGI